MFRRMLSGLTGVCGFSVRLDWGFEDPIRVLCTQDSRSYSFVFVKVPYVQNKKLEFVEISWGC